MLVSANQVAVGDHRYAVFFCDFTQDHILLNVWLSGVYILVIALAVELTFRKVVISGVTKDKTACAFRGINI